MIHVIKQCYPKKKKNRCKIYKDNSYVLKIVLIKRI